MEAGVKWRERVPLSKSKHTCKIIIDIKCVCSVLRVETLEVKSMRVFHHIFLVREVDFYIKYCNLLVGLVGGGKSIDIFGGMKGLFYGESGYFSVIMVMRERVKVEQNER